MLLTSAAGMLDALSYLRSGVFTANMTGNTVVLGLGLAGFDQSRLVPVAVSLASFALGCLIAAMFLVRPSALDEWTRDIKIGLRLELPFLAVFALLSALPPGGDSPLYRLTLVATAACALGIQSVAVRRLRIAGVVTTFITGTLTAGIAALVAKITPETQPAERSSPALLFTILMVYVLAAAAAATLARTHTAAAGSLPAVAVLVVMVR